MKIKLIKYPDSIDNAIKILLQDEAVVSVLQKYRKYKGYETRLIIRLLAIGLKHKEEIS